MNYEFDAEKVKLQLQKKGASKYSPDKDGYTGGKMRKVCCHAFLRMELFDLRIWRNKKAVSFDREAEKWVAFDNSKNDCWVEGVQTAKREAAEG